jgi:type I restriction enzyme S subunit
MADKDTVPFSDLFEVPLRNGLTKPSAVRGAGIKMVNMKEIFADRRINGRPMERVPMSDAEKASSLLREGDLLFARQSLVLSGAGKCVLFIGDQEDVTFESHIIRCRLNRRVAEPAYYFYLFESKIGRDLIESIVEQVSAAGIRGTDLSRLCVPTPPLHEQKRIAGILGALDDKIELNRKMNDTLEQMAKALFKSWFIDFEPVRAKAAGRQPAGMDKATADLFPDSFEDTELGKTPKGWKTVKIDQICDINARTLSAKDELKTLEYIEISEVSRGNISNIATYTRGEEPSRARRRLRHGDTVLSTVRPDRESYFLSLNPPIHRLASTGFAVVSPKLAPWSFIYTALTQREVFEHLGKLADGGAYPAVRPEVIGGIMVTTPNQVKLLESFHNSCAPLLEQADANRTQSKILVKLRETLLSNLIGSGNLTISQE